MPDIDLRRRPPAVFGEITLRRGHPALSGFSEMHREVSMTNGFDVGEFAGAVGFYPANVRGDNVERTKA